MKHRKIGTAEVSAITGLSKPAILVRSNPDSPRYDEDFPRAYRLGKRSLRFSESEVLTWLESHRVKDASTERRSGPATLAYLELQSDGRYRFCCADGHTLREKNGEFQYWHHTHTYLMSISPRVAKRISHEELPCIHRIDLVDPSTGFPGHRYSDRIELLLRQPTFVNGFDELRKEWLDPEMTISWRLGHEPLLERIVYLVQDRPFDRVRHEPLELHIDELLAKPVDGWRNKSLHEGLVGNGYSAERALAVLRTSENIADLLELHILVVLLPDDRVVIDLAEPLKSYCDDKYQGNNEAL